MSTGEYGTLCSELPRILSRGWSWYGKMVSKVNITGVISAVNYRSVMTKGDRDQWCEV